jgi:hypothetical protein
MRQRGRRSAALVALPNVSGLPTRLTMPRGLTRPERSLFTKLIATCASRHFVESDAPLLISYVQATLLARRSAHNPKTIDTWERAIRLQATLATRLRLAPQARTDPKTVARGIVPRPAIEPWED